MTIGEQVEFDKMKNMAKRLSYVLNIGRIVQHHPFEQEHADAAKAAIDELYKFCVVDSKESIQNNTDKPISV